MLKCSNSFPFRITHVSTYNGLEFTNRLLNGKKEKYCIKPSKLNVVCEQNQIDHRCTKPSTPETNGMVEKANGIIKNKTIKIIKYISLEMMNQDLMNFLLHYNLYRGHGSLRKELKVKTSFNAIEKWNQLDSEIFTEKSEVFKIKVLVLI
jgi:transposase InsO family protein